MTAGARLSTVIRESNVRVPYIRLGPGLPTEAAQRSALAAAGLTEDELVQPYTDRPKLRAGEEPAWDYMMRDVRNEGGEQDEVWIARPAILANSEAEARERIVTLTEQGAVLVIASSGLRYSVRAEAAPDVRSALDLSRDVKADERALVLAKARAGRKARPAAFTPQQWKEARRLWADPAVTVKDAEARSGIGHRTLYRKLGVKGTAAFGRPVKGKRK